ncbi:50S ribosomal protein L24 [Candidatus Saccharibacteria bacterium]|nr:50S ribosomal protein L24 [Candidatus Saccharibacteria bacterium]
MAKNLKINDKVLVISGDHKGTEAKIVKIDRAGHKACLEGIGLVERHMKKSYMNPSGGKKTIHQGIDLSNLKLVEAAAPVKSKASKADAKKTDKAEKADKKKAKKGAK